MLKTCLAFWKSEPQYAYKRYACKKNMYTIILVSEANNTNKFSVRPRNKSWANKAKCKFEGFINYPTTALFVYFLKTRLFLTS